MLARVLFIFGHFISIFSSDVCSFILAPLMFVSIRSKFLLFTKTMQNIKTITILIDPANSNIAPGKLSMVCKIGNSC